MATPTQATTEEMSPPPPVEPLSPGDNASSPAREPTRGYSPEIPNPPPQSPPPTPPLATPVSSPSPPPLSQPPDSSPPPPTPPDQPAISPSPPHSRPSVPAPEISPPPPPDQPAISPSPPHSRPSVPAPESSPPPPPDQPAISPPPPHSRPSVPAPESSPEPPAPDQQRNPPQPPTFDTPLHSPPPSAPPPPPSAPPPPRPSPSAPPSERPAHSPSPPWDSELPEHPPPPGSKLPAHSPSPPPQRPAHSSPPPPPPEEIPSPPKPSPAPLPSKSSSSPTFPSPPLVVSPPSRPHSDYPSQNKPTPAVTDNSSDSSIRAAGIVGVSIGVALVLLSLIGVVVIWCFRRRRNKLSAIGGGYVMPSHMYSSPRLDSALLQTQSSTPLVGNRSSNRTFFSQSESGGFGQPKELFSYEELVKATNGFSDENLLGEGGFGCVYKGVLPDGRMVAVKQLKIGGGQGDREFKAEVETISRVHHRHLLSLLGYCVSENQRLLIYNYVPNKNLYFHLHGTPGLDWATRVKIAAGAARGLAYLHEDCHPRIIHRDIKSSNILLENNFHALVSDFGLAKLALDCNTHITTRVMGTFGYLAPEYALSGKLTEKSDVFSFGVVLLELVTGRKPVDTSQPLGDEGLVEWARPLLSHAIETEEFKALADPKLRGNYVDAEMFRMIEAAAACIRHSAAKRPRMSQIVRAFDSLAEEDLTNGMRIGESEIMNSAQQSAEIRLFRRMSFVSQNYSTDFVTRNSFNSRDENL